MNHELFREVLQERFQVTEKRVMMIININNKSIIKKNKNIVERKLMGRIILLPIESYIENLDYIYTLEDVSVDIWDSINNKRTVEEITQLISKKYEVDEEIVSQDLIDLLDELKNDDLIVIDND